MLHSLVFVVFFFHSFTRQELYWFIDLNFCSVNEIDTLGICITLGFLQIRLSHKRLLYLLQSLQHSKLYHVVNVYLKKKYQNCIQNHQVLQHQNRGSNWLLVNPQA